MIEARLTLPRRGFALDLALALPSRGVSALFGPSGCGKTTVLRALAGLERAAGRVVVDGEVWQDDASHRFVPTHRRPIGYVIQESVLFPHLDVRGNLAFASRRAARDRPPRIALDQAIGLLGIEQLLARRPATLSGGERQRVAIARALASDPQLLLMDEPLAALDAQRKAELLPHLDRLHDELGLPIVYVSHALDEVARLADHLVLMEEGAVRAAGPLAELLARLDLPLARIDEAGVVLDGVVGERDDAWRLARLDVAAVPTTAATTRSMPPHPGSAAAPIVASFWARDQGLPLGRRVRLRVLARDVSVSRQPTPDSSIANQLPAMVETIADDAHPALALVRLRIGAAVPVVARLTRRSAHALGLAPGASVWAHVKTVALME